MMIKILKTSVIVALLSYLLKIFYLHLVSNGVAVHYNKVIPGDCRVIPGIECGSEQISVTSDGFAFITNGFRILTNCNKDFLKGRIYLFDFSNPENGAVQLSIVSNSIKDESFDPHGMDIFEDGSNVKIYVVNHANKKESIEVFKYDRSKPTQVEHTNTIVNENFICLNDITVLDENSFYVTNFVRFCHSGTIILSAVEFFGGLPTANIVYYSNGQSRIVIENESYLNGITLSNNKEQVIVAGNKYGTLHVYNRKDDGSLKLLKKLFVGDHPDNVYLDKFTGTYFIGTHKTPYQLLLAAFNQTDSVAGSGIQVIPSDNTWEQVQVIEILHMDGQKFVKGISSVAHYHGQYLFGSVFHKLGYCRKQ